MPKGKCTNLDLNGKSCPSGFASAPLAFATASIPMVYVGHHSEHELENSVVVGLHRVFPICDVAIIVDSKPGAR
jgi:hypothetical protein